MPAPKAPRWVDLSMAARPVMDELSLLGPDAMAVLAKAIEDGELTVRLFRLTDEGRSPMAEVVPLAYFRDGGKLNDLEGWVEVDRDGVLDWLKGAPQPHNVRGAGRKPTYEWAGFWRKVALLAADPDFDKNNDAELIAKMIDFFGEEADESTIRKPLKEFLNELRKN